jgi:hypothetical protein
MKSIPILAYMAVLLGGCTVGQPDFTPVGDGLKAIGISLVVYGVMKSLVELMRADEQKPKSQPPPKSRKSPGAKQAGGGVP